MPTEASTRPARPGWQRWIIRHLFLYLVLIAGVTVAVSIIVAPEDIEHAVRALPPLLALGVLALSTLNYFIRFLKWDRLLLDSSIRIPRASSARIYFACLAMVVTPARLGELYKLVFLRRLHGVSPTRSIPPLVLERATDALALVALCAAHPFAGLPGAFWVALAAGGLVLLAAALAAPATRRPLLALLGRLPVLAARMDHVDRLIEGHALLLRPRSFAVSLGLSVLAWWAECVGLWLICRGLDADLSVLNATWIYAASTLLGNLTFLPGGLGGTEIALKKFLEAVRVSGTIALPATLLIRAATLWYAVLIGLLVTLLGRKRLQWGAVRNEAAAGG